MYSEEINTGLIGTLKDEGLEPVTIGAPPILFGSG